MKINFIKALLLACQFLVAGQVFAAPTCPAEPIKLALFEFGVFHKELRGTNAGVGIDDDIVAELSRRSGCKFEVSLQARARTWIELKLGRWDMTVSGVRTDERDEFFWFVPYYQLRHSVLLGSGAPPSMHSLADFQLSKTLKFGVVRSFKHNLFYDALISKWQQNGRIEEYVDEPSLLDGLKRGEVAAMLSYPAVFRSYLQPEDLSPKLIRSVDWNPGEGNIKGSLVLSKRNFSKESFAEWEKLIKEMKDDGTLIRIFRKYLNEKEALNMLV
jgi:polar amino acid transport system substrate-binding protein